MQRKRIRRISGGLLIFFSLAVLFFTYYPLFNLYTQLPPTIPVLKDGYYLSVPKITAAAPITVAVNPQNPRDYLPVLEKGIAQAQGTALPGERGTIFLFAHSSDVPWKITRYNTPFLRLGELQPGDKISINHGSQKYEYSVREKKEVWPNEIQYLKNTGKNQLILQTCTPIGTSFKRLLVFADPV